jgi:hypothetical protein
MEVIMLRKPIPAREEGRAMLFSTDTRRARAMIEDDLDHQGLDIVLPGEDQARSDMSPGHPGEALVRSHHEVRWVPPM